MTMVTDLPEGEAGRVTLSAAETLNHLTLTIDLRAEPIDVAATLAAAKTLVALFDRRASPMDRELAAIAAECLTKGIGGLER